MFEWFFSTLTTIDSYPFRRRASTSSVRSKGDLSPDMQNPETRQVRQDLLGPNFPESYSSAVQMRHPSEWGSLLKIKNFKKNLSSGSSGSMLKASTPSEKGLLFIKSPQFTPSQEIFGPMVKRLFKDKFSWIIKKP